MAPSEKWFLPRVGAFRRSAIVCQYWAVCLPS